MALPDRFKFDFGPADAAMSQQEMFLFDKDDVPFRFAREGDEFVKTSEQWEEIHYKHDVLYDEKDLRVAYDPHKVTFRTLRLKTDG